jgi:hypothetical protein
MAVENALKIGTGGEDTLREASCQGPRDGNKRLALTAAIAFYGLNGRRLTLTNNAAYDLVIGVAAGDLDAADEIAAVLRQATRPAR